MSGSRIISATLLLGGIIACTGREAAPPPRTVPVKALVQETRIIPPLAPGNHTARPPSWLEEIPAPSDGAVHFVGVSRPRLSAQQALSDAFADAMFKVAAFIGAEVSSSSLSRREVTTTRGISAVSGSSSEATVVDLERISSSDLQERGRHLEAREVHLGDGSLLRVDHHAAVLVAVPHGALERGRQELVERQRVEAERRAEEALRRQEAEEQERQRREAEQRRRHRLELCTVGMTFSGQGSFPADLGRELGAKLTPSFRLSLGGAFRLGGSVACLCRPSRLSGHFCEGSGTIELRRRDSLLLALPLEAYRGFDPASTSTACSAVATAAAEAVGPKLRAVLERTREEEVGP